MEELDRELQAAIKRSEMRLSEALLGGSDRPSSPTDLVLAYLDDHPGGANFDDLQKAAGVSGRVIVQLMATLLDGGKIRQEFPLFLPVKQSAN